MRALTISAHGGLETVQFRTDVPVPEPPAGWVRVRVRAAALNHIDLFVIGGLPKSKVTPNWVLGADATGVVDALGGGVSGINAGEHVVIDPGVCTADDEYTRRGDHPLSPGYGILGEHLHGTFAEFVVVPAGNVRAIAPNVPVDQAAAMGLVSITAWRMLHTRARVTKDDDVLIWGIGGGVALASLLICKHIGARVWVTSSSDEKLARAKQLGADETINHKGADVGKIVRERTGKRGVTVVVDSVGAATWSQSLGALGRGGRLVTCGGTSGPMVETDLRRLFWSQWTLMGSTMGSPAEFTAAVDAFSAGWLRVPVDSTFPLERGRDALARLQSGAQFGKVVLTI